MKKPYKFIGGPLDGCVEHVNDEVTYLEAPEPLSGLPSFCGTVQLRKVSYQRMAFAGETKRFEIFVEAGITADEVMRRLIARYRKES
jgi:hypothetical protein